MDVEQSPENPWEEYGFTDGLMGLPMPIEYNTNLSREVLSDRIKEESVYVVRNQHESVMYGKVTLSGDKIWIHSSEPQKPDGTPILMPLKELLFVFNGATKFPIKAFLQIGDETSVLGDVVIATGRSSPRAFNFLLLCSGIKGSSYKGKTLKRYSNTVGTVSSEEVTAVVNGITDGGVYEASVEKGIVCGCWCRHPDNLSRFNIWMERPLVRVTTKFGYVEEGLETLERLFEDNQCYQIKDCGLVIKSAKTVTAIKNVVSESPVGAEVPLPALPRPPVGVAVPLPDPPRPVGVAIPLPAPPPPVTAIAPLTIDNLFD